jgi:hypothetical protein
MAETLEPCCRQARDAYIERITKTIVSYPVIKDIPCPKCRRIIPIRLYGPPTAGEAA